MSALEDVMEPDTERFTDEVFAAGDDTARIAAVERFLARAEARKRAEDPRLCQAIVRLSQDDARASVRDVALAVHLSERQLERS